MILELDFSSVNVSLQIGDIVYFSTTVGGISGMNHYNAGSLDTKVKILGLCVGITNTIVAVDTSQGGGSGWTTSDVSAGVTAFMFQKDKNAGLSGITGYYALTEYRNYATVPAEMFATAVDYVESSK